MTDLNAIRGEYTKLLQVQKLQVNEPIQKISMVT